MRLQPLTGLLSLATLAALAACGPATRNDGTGTDGGAGNGGDGGSNATGGDGGGSTNGCSVASQYVYVVDENNTLSQFDPSTKTFHDLGSLSCPAQADASPFSMGVDRNANAWVLYSSGELFQVNTTTLACTKTSWTGGNGLSEFGMGFSTDAVGGTVDQLFIAGGAGPTEGSAATLATLDTTGLAATTVGTINGWPELTGTGNADLWGFFPDATHPRIDQITKTSGAAAKTFSLSALRGDPAAWAFAAWGGDFWVFLMTTDQSATTVYQISGTNGTVLGHTDTGTRTIVGAGVSTCAPVVIQ